MPQPGYYPGYPATAYYPSAYPGYAPGPGVYNYQNHATGQQTAQQTPDVPPAPEEAPPGAEELAQAQQPASTAPAEAQVHPEVPCWLLARNKQVHQYGIDAQHLPDAKGHRKRSASKALANASCSALQSSILAEQVQLNIHVYVHTRIGRWCEYDGHPGRLNRKPF